MKTTPYGRTAAPPAGSAPRPLKRPPSPVARCRSEGAPWRTAGALLLFLFLLSGAGRPAQAQERAAEGEAGAQADTLAYALGPVEVFATPFNISAATAPFAVSHRRRTAADLNADPTLALEDLAATVPGLWVNTRTHYATGQRITIRGLGWRSQFGVRGVQVILDGIPLTMADGQAILNIVDPSFVREVEVIRGPASTFWGNAAGGVLYLSTKPAAGAPHRVRAKQTVGSYGLRKTDVQVTPNLGRHRLSAYTSYLAQDGFRQHSQVRLSRTGLTGTYALGETSGIEYMGAYSSMPEAENPSSLDDSTAAADPRAVRDLIVRQGVGKTSQQGQLGLTYYTRTGVGRVRMTGYGVFRELDNPIPFGYIDLSRRAGGTRLTLHSEQGRLDWGLGLEGKLQRDDRREFSNDDGAPGTLQIDQLETVYNAAAFGRASLPLAGRLRLSAGLRYDWLRFEADVQQGAIATGAQTFWALSPSLGLLYEAGPGTRLFANLSTALEAPTASELGNRPGGGGGFNPDLEPERTLGVEAGVQGLLAGLGFSYDVALFAMQVRDLLEAYEDATETTFFRNAGQARHLGAEAALRWRGPHALALDASYTLVRATFTEAGDAALDGNRIPGIPEQVFGAEVAWQRPDFAWAALTLRRVSSFYVNSTNTARNDGYLVLDARLSYPGLPLGPRLALTPFVAVENALDARYNDTVVNAFGGRYYEPAAGRHWSAGLTATFD